MTAFGRRVRYAYLNLPLHGLSSSLTARKEFSLLLDVGLCTCDEALVEKRLPEPTYVHAVQCPEQHAHVPFCKMQVCALMMHWMESACLNLSLHAVLISNSKSSPDL